MVEGSDQEGMIGVVVGEANDPFPVKICFTDPVSGNKFTAFHAMEDLVSLKVLPCKSDFWVPSNQIGGKRAVFPAGMVGGGGSDRPNRRGSIPKSCKVPKSGSKRGVPLFWARLGDFR